MGGAMHVVLVTPEYPPMVALGGIGTHTAVTAAALAKRGHRVTVVTYAGPEHDTTTGDGVHVVRLRERWLPNAAMRIAARRALTALAIARLRPKPDVVHAAEWQAEAVALVLAPGGPPLVTRLATPTYVVDELNASSGQQARRLVDWMERSQARASAAVYAPSRAIATRVGTDWGVPVTEVIPNSIDVASVRAAGRREPPVELPERFVVFLGRLERRKGLDALGPALAEVMRERAGLHAVLVGYDSGEAGGSVVRGLHDATAAVRDRVHLLGELRNEDALAVAARAELAVLPSRWESFGFVCVEALALGVPVVATNVGGFAEIVEDGVSGWLVPPDDPRRLAAAVARALDDGAMRDMAAEAALRRAEEYDVARVVERVEALLTRVAGARTGHVPAAAADDGYRRFFQPDSPRDPFGALYEEKRACIAGGLRALPPAHVVDVGGGFGRLAERLRGHHDVVLCDLSAEMLGEARTRFGTSVPLLRADARALPIATGSVAVAVAVDLLVHLPDLDAAVAELARPVAAGGRLVFDSTNAAPWWVLRYPAYVDWRPRRLVRTLAGDGVLPEWQASVSHQHRSDVEAAIARAGLVLERRDDIGPSWCPKWHVWWTRKAAV
jgi:glycogen(starch) synthase